MQSQIAAGGAVSKSADKSASANLRHRVNASSTPQRADQIDHYSETTVVQTGGGAPNWNLGSTAWLSWNGPVLATQDMHLLIVPPWLVRLLRIVLVTLLAWLLWRLVRGAVGPDRTRRAGRCCSAEHSAWQCCRRTRRRKPDPSRATSSAAAPALSEAPKVRPACASIAEAQVTASGETLTAALEVHAGERVALPLPAMRPARPFCVYKWTERPTMRCCAMRTAACGWRSAAACIACRSTFAAHGDKVALAFPLKPARGPVPGRGWDAAGHRRRPPADRNADACPRARQRECDTPGSATTAACSSSRRTCASCASSTSAWSGAPRRR
jgi:hypothetical protein